MTNGGLSAKADETYSVTDFIGMRSTDENTYYNYSILDYEDGYEYLITSLLYDYQDELESAASTVKLTDEEFVKYKYKPWLLAYDVYGSSEAFFIIYLLNNILTDREFDFRKVKLIPSQTLSTILGRIYSANSTYMNNMASKLKDTEKVDTEGNTIW